MVSLSLFSKSRTEFASWTGTFCFAFGWIPKEGGSLPLALGHPIGARSIPVGGRFQRGQRSLGRKNPKKPAVSWHTTLHEVRQRRTSDSDCLQSPSEASERRSRLMAGIAKYSVLYLHPRLTGKRSVSTMERSFCSAGKRAGFCECKRIKT